MVSDFFVLDNQLWWKDHQEGHKLVIPQDYCYSLLKQAYDDLGHKGIFMVCLKLLEQFWWLYLKANVKWYIQTCHKYQTYSLQKLIILPTVPTPVGLFQKIYVDTMLIPKVCSFHYILHTQCSLILYPEWSATYSNDFKEISKFLLQILSC